MHVSGLARGLRAPARVWVQQFLEDEQGQDMVEYVLVFMLIGLSAIAGTHGVAAQISAIFGSLGPSLTSNV